MAERIKGIGRWIRGRDGWDLASVALLLLFLVLVLVNISAYPVFLDIPYHMAVTQGFREAGGVTTWDFWDYAPEGRPHLYPPLLHVGMSLLMDLGLSQRAVATLVCLAIFPLVMLTLWWMMRRLFGTRAAFLSLIFLCVPYAFLWQTGITVAASLVLALTPLVFLALEKDRRVAAALLLAMCLYSHLVLGHLVALALVVYLAHRRRYWKRILAALALAYLLYLPWGLVIITNLSSLHFSEPGGGGNIVLHLLAWLAALAGAAVCYRKKGRYYLLPSYLLSMVPIAFFYPNRFWEGHVFLPLAMLGAVALDRLCAALRGALDRRGVAAAASRPAVAVLATSMALLLLLVDPVLAAGGTGGAQALPGKQAGNPPAGMGTARPPLGQAPPPAGEPRGPVARQLRERLPGLREARESPLRLALEPTSFLVLAGMEEAARRPLAGEEVFGEENEALMLAVRENSRPGDVVFVLDGRLGDLIYAMTGRYTTRGMFHEVQPEDGSQPIQQLAGADLAVIGGVGGPLQGTALQGTAGQGTAGRGNGLPGDPRGWKTVAREGRYVVLAKEGLGGGDVRTSDAAVPLGAAYALLALAVVACFWDLCRRGPVFPRGGGGVGRAGSPHGGGGGYGEGGRANTYDKGQGSTLSLFGGARLNGPAAGGGMGRMCVPGAIPSETLLLVPAYNEAAGVARLVREIKGMYPEADVLVLDDGSRDGTAEQAYGAGAAVLRSSQNRGVGEMMRQGLSFAYRRGYRFAVRLDGDGQHPPEYVPALLEPIERGEAEVTVGSRFLREAPVHDKPSLPRRLGMAYFRLILRIATRRAFSDPTSGFQAYSREAMRFLAGQGSRRYPEVFMLLLLTRGGDRVREVEVEMRPRRYGRSTIGMREALSMAAGATACLLRHPG